MRSVAIYLQSERVPQSLIDTMMSHASNDIHWLTSEEIKSLDKYKAGMKEELIAKCGYDVKREEQMSPREWFRDQSIGTGACINDYTVDTYWPLTKDAIMHMRNGWRPW